MSFRKIKIGDQEWEYFIGKGNVVIKYPASKIKDIIPFGELTGLSNTVIENMQDNKTFSITPKQIREYIENNLK